MPSLGRLLRFFPGWIQAEAEGGYPERLLNEATAAGVELWGIRYRRESVRFCCYAREYRRMRQPARRACVRMRVRRRSGLPFWLFQYRHRRGLLVGTVVYCLILALLAPRIWVIQVVGNESTPVQPILAEAAAVGVRLGAPTDELDIKRLEIEGLSRLPSLSWITVNPSGCVARVEVLERKQPPAVLDLTEPSDMVAVRDGLVLSMTVQSGEPRVMVGEAVSAGTVLIAGRRQTELGERLSRSYGEVWAETHRQITVTVPLVYARQIPGADAVVQPTLHFLHWQIPLFSPGTPVGEYRVMQREHFLQAGELTLPLGVSTVYHVPVETVKTARTAGGAAAIANRRLARQEAAVFAGVEYTVSTRRETVQHGVYTLTVEYICRENIAAEAPLAPADPENQP